MLVDDIKKAPLKGDTFIITKLSMVVSKLAFPLKQMINL